MALIKIAPSILSADFSKMGDAVSSLEKNGADMIHCDVMDGVFVKNITFGPKMIRDIRKHTALPLDCHLMIVNPENYIEKFAEAGASFITVHKEACGENLPVVLKSIKSLGCKCGLVLNPDTPLKSVYASIELCDILLLMSVFPGFGGQKFIESVFPKLSEARKIIDCSGRNIDLEVDGGVNAENVRRIKEAGANVIVAGSAVFKANDVKKAIDSLREA